MKSFRILSLPKQNVFANYIPTSFDHKLIFIVILFSFPIGMKNPIFKPTFVSEDNKEERIGL